MNAANRHRFGSKQESGRRPTRRLRREGFAMMRKSGFTLVELLVVIAIISILAAIVVPNVSSHIAEGRKAKAVAEISNLNTAVTKLLADSGKSKFGHFWTWSIDPTTLPLNETTDIYSDVFYELLRRGRDADISDYAGKIAFKPDVLKKLGTSYLDINMDPWGENEYKFFVGPLAAATFSYVPFRAYRSKDDGTEYIYNSAAFTEAQAKMRGNPPADDKPGYPAPRDLPIYIYSFGENMQSDQGTGGGDDINNWDTAAGWDELY